MTITKRVGGLLASAAAVVALVGLSATPAMASTTLTAKVTGGGSITATTGTKGKTVLTDNGISVTCIPKGSTPASEAKGSITNGTHKGAEPVAVGSTTKLTFNNCSGILGIVKNKVESEGKISVDSKTNSAGDTAGVIGPVTVAVSMKDCAFTVTGFAPGYYSNKTHELVVTPNLPKGLKGLFKAQLTISGVPSGECSGVIKDGQHPTFVSTYTVSRKVVIKST